MYVNTCTEQNSVTGMVMTPKKMMVASAAVGLYKPIDD
jgi:hypothetical protein